MKILFKNTTKYTKENCANFEEFHTNKFGKKELLKFLLYAIIVLYIFIFNIVYKNWIFLLTAIVAIMMIQYIEKKKKEKKKNTKSKVKQFTFFFYEKYIKIKYKKEFERMTYFQFHKIFETEEYFYLYLDERKSLILDKEGFEIGTAKEFSKFIKNKCPFKYRNEKKMQSKEKEDNKNKKQ